jgi:protein O-mannosyl-transferase
MRAKHKNPDFIDAKPAWPRFPALRRWDLDAQQTTMLAGVLLLTALTYLRCLGNGFVYDDHAQIEKNLQISQWSFLYQALTRDLWWFTHLKETQPRDPYYRPLQNIWLGLSYHLVRRNPAGWHLLKIALHLGVVVAAFRLAQLLTASVAAGLLTALLFGLLPVHAESVVWASAIAEPLSALFELGVLCLFIRRSKPHWSGAIWPLVLFAGAMFTHESAVVFPVIIALYVFLFETDGDGSARPLSLRKRIGTATAWSMPFFGVDLIYMGARVLVLGPAGTFGFLAQSKRAALINGQVIISTTPVTHGFAQIFTTIPTVLLHHLELLAFPWLAGPAHDVRFVTSPGVRDFFVPVAILALLAMTAHLAFRQSPHRRLYVFLVLWWLITLAPGLAPAMRLGQDMNLIQDRYQYLPSFAFCVMLANLAVQFAQASSVRFRATSAVAAVLTAVYVTVLWRAQPVWRDDVALFSRCVENSPDSAFYHGQLASALIDLGDLQGAVRQLRDAATLAPDEPGLHLELGFLYLRMKHSTDAARELEAYYRTAFAEKRQTAQPHWYVEFK